MYRGGGRGRGSFGGYRGRGRGRFGNFGRGGAPSSKKWFRPTGDVSSVQETRQSNSGDSNQALSETANAVTESAAPTNKKETKVVLKGPKRYPKAYAASHTWKRPAEEVSRNESITETDPDIKAQSAASVASVPKQAKSQVSVDSSLNPPDAAEPVPMLRRGKNKLVSKQRIEDESNAVMPETVSAKQTGDSEKPAAALTKSGTNKLVLQGVNNKKDTREIWNRNSHHHASSYSSRGRGGVKRIKLNPSSTDDIVAEGDEHEAAGNDGSDGEGAKERRQASEKYTEFAYRQSSRRTQRGGRGGGSRGGGRSGNMGLVRVEPDSGRTRMCPVYLKGEECTNPKCTKRHDVPLEAAVPICSFFQRNGMCNKGDKCQFRHIKVNPHATICPSFSLLGFCEDKDCVMQHIRAPNKKSKRGR